MSTENVPTVTLKPCPFCGATPDTNDPLTFQSDQGDKWGFVVCCCRGPEVRTGYGPVEEWKADAIAAWNERASAPSSTQKPREGAGPEFVDVFWSDEDQTWIAHYRGREEWRHLNAFGATRQDALRELATAAALMAGVDIHQSLLERPTTPTERPIPMVLHCPECRTRHIDEGEFATKAHHTHACQGCGLVWRPAIGPTVGVQFLPKFKNADASSTTPTAAPSSEPTCGHPFESLRSMYRGRDFDYYVCQLCGAAIGHNPTLPVAEPTADEPQEGSDAKCVDAQQRGRVKNTDSIPQECDAGGTAHPAAPSSEPTPNPYQCTGTIHNTDTRCNRRDGHLGFHFFCFQCAGICDCQTPCQGCDEPPCKIGDDYHRSIGHACKSCSPVAADEDERAFDAFWNHYDGDYDDGCVCASDAWRAALAYARRTAHRKETEKP